MGREERITEKEKAMRDRAFIVGRRELVQRLAASVQEITKSAAVTLSITWAEEKDDTLEAVAHHVTLYGETSAGRPIRALPGSAPFACALAHLAQTAVTIERQTEEMKKNAAIAAGSNGKQGVPGESHDEEAGGGDQPRGDEEPTDQEHVGTDEEAPTLVPETPGDEGEPH